MGGSPYLGDMQSAIFSPFSLPAYVLPFWWSLSVIAAMKVVVAAMGAFLLARVLEDALRRSLPVRHGVRVRPLPGGLASLAPGQRLPPDPLAAPGHGTAHPPARSPVGVVPGRRRGSAVLRRPPRDERARPVRGGGLFRPARAAVPRRGGGGHGRRRPGRDVAARRPGAGRATTGRRLRPGHRGGDGGGRRRHRPLPGITAELLRPGVTTAQPGARPTEVLLRLAVAELLPREFRDRDGLLRRSPPAHAGLHRPPAGTGRPGRHRPVRGPVHRRRPRRPALLRRGRPAARIRPHLPEPPHHPVSPVHRPPRRLGPRRPRAPATPWSAAPWAPARWPRPCSSRP